jgi:hypothetical protein
MSTPAWLPVQAGVIWWLSDQRPASVASVPEAGREEETSNDDRLDEHVVLVYHWEWRARFGISSHKTSRLDVEAQGWLVRLLCAFLREWVDQTECHICSSKESTSPDSRINGRQTNQIVLQCRHGRIGQLLGTTGDSCCPAGSSSVGMALSEVQEMPAAM